MAYFPQNDPFGHLRNDPNSTGQQQKNAQSGVTGSLKNAIVQGTASKPSGNAFEAMLNHVVKLNGSSLPALDPNAATKAAAPQSFTPDSSTPWLYGKPEKEGFGGQPSQGFNGYRLRPAPPGSQEKIFNNVDNPDAGEGQIGGGSGTTPGQPNTTPGSSKPEDPGKGPQNPDDPRLRTQPPPSGQYTASNGQKYPIPPVPQGVDPRLWQDVTGYVTEAGLQGADYTWLWTHPNAVQEFRAWAVANPNRRNVDIVDWLRHNYGAAQGIQANHSLAGRRGYDTFVFSPAGVPWGHPQDGTGGRGINPTAPQQPQNSIDANGVPLLPGYRPPSNPNATGPNGGPGNQPAPPLGPPPPAPPVEPPVKVIPTEEPYVPVEEVEPKAVVPPEEAAPERPTLPPDWVGEFNPGEGDTFKRYEELLNPFYDRMQDKFAKKLRAQGALSGNIDSGGFGQNMAEGLASLQAEFGKDLADKVTVAHEKALDRVLQKYGIDTGARTTMYQIDTQKFIAQIQDDTARLGIKTNADLERYLGDRKLELERYGIDTNKWLEQYKADVQREVGFYSADASVKAASLHASAAQAAAGASAAAAQYDAQVRRELGILGFDIERENNIMDFIIGMGGINNDFLGWIASQSPDKWLQGIGGNGTTIITP